MVYDTQKAVSCDLLDSHHLDSPMVLLQVNFLMTQKVFLTKSFPALVLYTHRIVACVSHCCMKSILLAEIFLILLKHSGMLPVVKNPVPDHMVTLAEALSHTHCTYMVSPPGWYPAGCGLSSTRSHSHIPETQLVPGSFLRRSGVMESTPGERGLGLRFILSSWLLSW